MEQNRGFNKASKILKTILILLIVFLIMYIAMSFVKIKDEDLGSKILTFFQVFTTGVDTKIEKEDNTILEGKKKVEIDQSSGEVEVESGSKEPMLQPEKKDVEIYADPATSSSNSNYYNQLDEYGKIIYTKLKKESGYFLEGKHTFDFGYGFNDLLNSDGGDIKLKESFQHSINAIVFDYPELFFVDIEKISLSIERTEYNNNTVVNKVAITNIEGENFYIKGLNNKEEVNKKRQEVYAVREKILNKIQNMNTYDKIQYIHDYIVDNSEYDQKLSGNNIYNILGPLIDGSAVCEGYAKAFKFLMDGAKIQTIVIAGKAYDGAGSVERHAWNYVNLNNNWYLVDTTWDDPIIFGEQGLTSEYKYKYFLVGRNSTKDSHIEDGNIVNEAAFKYPELSEYAFSR